MGRREGGYRSLVVTSSLSPCPFCQRTFARHLGVHEIRILDAENYVPDLSSYARCKLEPVIANDRRIIDLFRAWLQDPANALIWKRDIGIWEGAVDPVFDSENARAMQRLIGVAHEQARRALERGEAPIGAVICDSAGEVIGVGSSSVVTTNDPSSVAAMSAWRACGARDHWRDKTLVLTAGPDSIAKSMFDPFSFGQLIVASTQVYAGLIDEVAGLKRAVGPVRVRVLGDGRSDAALSAWLRKNSVERAREYLGIEWAG